MSNPRILVACEYSGIVREAFAARGWEAWSCDLLPSEQIGNHYQGDVRDMLTDHWDMMIAHPPCTYLTNAGARWLYQADGSPSVKRWELMEEGAEFFNIFRNTNISFVAIENPIMHRHARERVGGRATQYVQPYHFGTPESKSTGLRLYGLPLLKRTNDVEAYMRTLPKRETDKVHYASPGPDRWKERSRTYPAIAQAMADQWGPYVEARYITERAKDGIYT